MEKQRYMNLIEGLANGYTSFACFLDNPTELNFWEFERDVVEAAEENFETACGCTKGVIIFNDEEYVIKIPFKGGRGYVPLDESDVYSYAKDEGLEEFFAACYNIGTYSECDIYIMEKVRIDEDMVISSGIQSYRRICCDDETPDEEIEYSLTELIGDTVSSANFVEYCFKDFYNEKDVNRLVNFINDYNINDLHEGNMGFTDDGYIILIDYSGI